MPTAIFNAASASAELITLPNSDSEIIFEAVRRLVPPYFDSNKKLFSRDYVVSKRKRNIICHFN